MGHIATRLRACAPSEEGRNKHVVQRMLSVILCTAVTVQRRCRSPAGYVAFTRTRVPTTTALQFELEKKLSPCTGTESLLIFPGEAVFRSPLLSPAPFSVLPLCALVHRYRREERTPAGRGARRQQFEETSPLMYVGRCAYPLPTLDTLHYKRAEHQGDRENGRSRARQQNFGVLTPSSAR